MKRYSLLSSTILKGGREKESKIMKCLYTMLLHLNSHWNVQNYYKFTFFTLQVEAGVAGIRLLCNKLLAESNELLEVDSDQYVCLQVTLCKVPKNKDKRSPLTIKMFVFYILYLLLLFFFLLKSSIRKHPVDTDEKWKIFILF